MAKDASVIHPAGSVVAVPASPVVAVVEAGRRKSGRKPRDPNETPAARFRRLGAARVGSAIVALRLVRQIFVVGQYEWTPEQAEKVILALEAEHVQIASAARNPSASAQKQKDLFAV